MTKPREFKLFYECDEDDWVIRDEHNKRPVLGTHHKFHVIEKSAYDELERQLAGQKFLKDKTRAELIVANEDLDEALARMALLEDALRKVRNTYQYAVTSLDQETITTINQALAQSQRKIEDVENRRAHKVVVNRDGKSVWVSSEGHKESTHDAVLIVWAKKDDREGEG